MTGVALALAGALVGIDLFVVGAVALIRLFRAVAS